MAGASSTPKPKRKAISTKTRFEVFKRDRFTCQYCGAHPPGVLLHIDHITAVVSGGTNAIDNLVTACEPCNLGKGARPLHAVPQTLAAKAKETQERESQLLGYQAILEGRRLRIEAETWRVLEHLAGSSLKDAPRDDFGSVQRFIERLGVHSVLEAVDIALASPVAYHKRFRYFCGVCWNRIREAESA